MKDLIKDLKEYVVEDDYPTSTISNIYFDTENFEVIQDALAKQHRREKIRMRTYIETPQADSPVFLEVKSKDEEGIGHKFRLVATSQAIINLMTDGTVDHPVSYTHLANFCYESRACLPHSSRRNDQYLV